MKEKILSYIKGDIIGAIATLVLFFIIFGNFTYITNISYVLFLIGFIEFYFFRKHTIMIQSSFLSFLRKVTLARIFIIIYFLFMTIYTGLLNPKIMTILPLGLISSSFFYILSVEWSSEFFDKQSIQLSNYKNLIFAAIGTTLLGFLIAP